MTSSQMLWYTTRATGVVALVLLTGATVLGVLTSMRFGSRRWPRFAFQDFHRRISLLAVVFVAMHVITTVSDSFAPIGWVSVVVPFISPYRRLWLGLGTLAVDLLIAVTVSSILRRRISPRTWRALHWLAYASWPVALLHGLGTGTDPHLEWMIILVVCCVGAVLAAVACRLISGSPARAGARLAAGAVGLAAVVSAAVWTTTGPLRPGWAVRAGTPPALLAGAPKVVVKPAANAPARVANGLLAPPYRSTVTGTITRQVQSGGSVRLAIHGRTSGAVAAVLDIVITGNPDGSDGVIMRQSHVTFGPAGGPTQYQGRIIELEGPLLVVALTDHSGTPIDLRVDLAISGSQVTGTLASVDASGNSAGLHDDN